MTKPAVTLRAVKGTALTYTELDDNFTNLKDATLSLTAGTGGTSVTSDLNGTITLVAGSNITLTGDNTAKTITIASTATGGGNPLTSDLDVNGYKITSTVTDGHIKLDAPGEGYTWIVGQSAYTRSRFGGTNDDIELKAGNSTGSDYSSLYVDDLVLNLNQITSSGDPTQVVLNGGNVTLHTSNGTGSVKIEGELTISSTTGTPSNTTTPTHWLKIGVGGITRYIPLYT